MPTYLSMGLPYQDAVGNVLVSEKKKKKFDIVLERSLWEACILTNEDYKFYQWNMCHLLTESNEIVTY